MFSRVSHIYKAYATVDPLPIRCHCLAFLVARHDLGMTAILEGSSWVWWDLYRDWSKPQRAYTCELK